jgi:cellulose synthase operon protein C
MEFAMVASSKFPLVILFRILLGSSILFIGGCNSPEQKAQSYYERGIKMLGQQDFVKAAIEFKNALQLKKDLVDAWRGLLTVETHNRNYEAVVPILRTVVELDPKDVEAKLHLGKIMLASNAFDQALDLANAVAELDEGSAAALALRAAALLKLNDVGGATREAQAALQIDPNNTEALLVLAAERLTRGDRDGALLILDGKALSDEKDVPIQLFKLQVLESTGDWKQAEALLRRLAELNPQESAFPQYLIKMYIGQKRFDDAENELRAIAAASPSDIERGLNVVRFLQKYNSLDAARQELVARVIAGGKVFQYQLALSEFDVAQGKVAEAIELLERLANDPRSAEDALLAKVKLAQVQFSRKKFEITESLISDILRKDGRNVDGLKLRALVRMEQGQLDAAIADLRQALNEQPQSSVLMLLLASAYERSGSIELAEKQYADATRIATESGVGLNYVAFLRRRGSLERAENVLMDLASRSPNSIPVLTALADVRLERRNWTGAQEVAAHIQRLGTAGEQPDQILAVALSGRGKYEDSLRVMESVRAAVPGAVEPMAAVVGTLVRENRLDQAVTFLHRVLQSNADNAEAHVLLGSVRLLQNSPDVAVKSFRAAVERQPTNMAGYQALAQFYVRQKKIDEAERIIRTGLNEKPEDPAMQLSLAGVLELKGDYEAAIAQYESMLKDQAGSMVVANNLAGLLSNHRSDKASLDRAFSLAAVLRKSEVPFFKDTLGWLYYLRGDYTGAIALLEQAAAELPDLPIVRYHLGASYVAAGQLEKASEQLAKAQELAAGDRNLEAKIKAEQQKSRI